MKPKDEADKTQKDSPIKVTGIIIGNATKSDTPFIQPLSSEEKYVIEKELGKGGMGIVFSALDKNIQRNVAMKIIALDQPSDVDNIVRFIEEVQITGQLEHPNIVPTYELGTTKDGKIYYTMKMVKGNTLETIIDELRRDRVSELKETAGGTAKGEAISELKEGKAGKQYSLTHLLQIFIQICNGIAFAHNKGVIHRDLKPENIMIGEFGEVLIMDWGLAKVIGQPERKISDTVKGGQPERKASDTVKGIRESAFATKTMDGAVIGTPSYMSPEQAAGDIAEIDERSDVYGLGAILYQIVTYEPPYVGTDAYRVIKDSIQKPVIPPRKRSPENRVPKEVEAICLKAMAKDKNERYSSANELASDIQNYLENKSISALPDSIPKRAFKWVKRNKMLTGSIVAVILAALGVYGILTYLQHYRTQEKISEFLIQAQAAKEQGDKVLQTELTPVENRLFNIRTLEEYRQIKKDIEDYYPQRQAKLKSVKNEYKKAIDNYGAVYQLDRDNKTANETLADIYRLYFDWEEKQNKTEEAGIYEQLIKLYDRKGRYADYLKGTGELKITSEPQDAEVYLFRLETTGDGRLAPEGYDTVDAAIQDMPRLQSFRLGKTPLHPFTLEMGSYLVLLRKEGYADTRYPVFIERQEKEIAEVKLYKPSDPPDGEAGIPEGMVYVPAGEFFPLSDLSLKVNLPGFLIAKYEITYKDFLEFLNDIKTEDAEKYAEHFKGGRQDRPSVLLKDAEGKYYFNLQLMKEENTSVPMPYLVIPQVEAYAKWKSSKYGGKYRLPNDEEWTKAARGADKRRFPWGDAANENFANVSRGEEDIRSKSVGSFPMDCSIYGVYDMGGNLSEWTSDFLITGGMKYFFMKGGRINNPVNIAEIDRGQPWLGTFSTFETGFRLVKEIE